MHPPGGGRGSPLRKIPCGRARPLDLPRLLDQGRPGARVRTRGDDDEEPDTDPWADDPDEAEW